MPKRIDFDADYMRFAAGKLRGRGEMSDSELTGALNETMNEWLNRKSEALGGKTPDEYFAGQSPMELAAQMADYCAEGMNVPEPLYRMLTRMEGSEEALSSVAQGERYCVEARATAFRILSDRGAKNLTDAAIALLGKGGDAEQAAVDYLESAGYGVVDALHAAYPEADEEKRRVILEVLCSYPGIEKTVRLLARQMFNDPDHYALYASFAEHLGDEGMIEPLMKLTRLTDIRYYDYKEVVNAIESLGGDPGPERHFDGDPDYEALRAADTMPDDLLS